MMRIKALLASWGQGVAAVLLLALAVGFTLYLAYPEVALRAPPLNDDILHLQGVEAMAKALGAGRDPTDTWLPSIALGYPLSHHYQHLPYLVPAVASLLLKGVAPLADVYNITRLLLLVLFPLSVYWSMRRFGFSGAQSAFAGLVAPLISTDGLFGLELGSYLWRGQGVYTQLWGMVLLPPALAQGHHAIREGRGYALAGLLLAALLLSHVVLAYVALGTLCTFVLLTPRRLVPGALRLLAVLVLAGLVSAYFLAGFLLDSAYLNRSVWEHQWKYDSFGAPWVLERLVKGQLLDSGRAPVLTLLSGVGMAVCLWRWREERYLAALALALLWLLLYFGRPAWGPLLDLLPMSRDLHFHRLIAGFHLGASFLAGIALALPWELVGTAVVRPPAGLRANGRMLILRAIAWAKPAGERGTSPRATPERAEARTTNLPQQALRWGLGVAVLVVTVLALLPMVQERGAYAGLNTRWMRESRDANRAEAGDLVALAQALRDAPPGRVYAGLGANWGKDYKVGSTPMYGLLNLAGFDMLGYLYHALSLNAEVQVLFDESRLDHYQLFNVRYIVAPAGRAAPPFARPLGSYGRHRLYQVPTSGYFDLVDSTLAFAGTREAFYPAASAWVQSALPSAGQYPALKLGLRSPDRDFPLPLGGAPATLAALPARAFDGAQATGPARGRVLSETVRAGDYGVQVEVARESYLVFKGTYHPGWRATVDGREAGTVMLMPSYVGVKLPPGRREVRLEYRAPPWRLPLLAFGLLLLVAVAVGERRGWGGRFGLWVRKRVDGLRLPGWGIRSGGPERIGETHAVSTRPTVTPTPAGRHEPAGGTAAVPGGGAVFPTPAGTHEGAGGTPALPGPSRRKGLLGVYLLLLGVYLLTASGHFWSTDHVSVYLTAQSLVEGQGLAIKPINDSIQGTGGRFYGVFGIGQSLALVPLYLAGRAVDSVVPEGLRRYFGGPDLGDWGGTVPVFFASLFNQLITPLTGVLVLLFCLRLGHPWRVSLGTAVLFGLGTAAWVGAHDSFQHPLEGLLLLASVYVLFVRRGRLTWRYALLAGALLGFGVATRINLLLMAPLLAGYVLCTGRPGFSIDLRMVVLGAIGWAQPARERGTSPRATFVSALQPGDSRGRLSLQVPWAELWERSKLVLWFGLPVLAGFAVVCAVAYLRFGDPLAFNPTVGRHGFSLATLGTGLYGNFFSVGRSIFLYSPPVVLGLVAWRGFYREHRAEAVLFPAIALVYLFFFSAYGSWHGDWSWGPRFLWPVLPFLLIPAVRLLRRRWGVAAAVALGLAGAFVQVLGVAVSVSFVYNDWLRAGFNPATAMLWVPDISAIPTHLRSVLAGRHVDLWLDWVYRQFGLGVLGLSLVVPGALTVWGLRLMGFRLVERLPAAVRRATLLPLTFRRRLG